MTQDETIALWNKCQAAKKVLLDQGKREDEAHEAAKEVWNAWAQEMLEQRKELEKAGEWQAEKDFMVIEKGKNTKTRDWLERAAADFSNTRFITLGTPPISRAQGNEESEASVKAEVKTISCEGWVINFTGFTFPSVANFIRATFSGHAIFDKATFSGDVRFVSATFSGSASFDLATFSGSASFGSATFSGHAIFDKATFSGDARFDDATFSGYVRFGLATFSGHASFDEGIFSGHAIFDKATFSGEATFSLTTFSGSASFGSATFSGSAWFDKATFFNDAHFDYAEFQQAARFGKAVFTQKVGFALIISKRSFSLADTHFSLVPDFTEADFHQPPRLDTIHIDRAGGYFKKVEANVSAMYRALKRQAEDAKDHDNEMKFFAGEMRTARYNSDMPFPLMGLGQYREPNAQRLEGWKKEQMSRYAQKQQWEQENKDKKAEEQEDIPDNAKFLPPFVERKVPFWSNGARFWFGMAYEFFSSFGRSLVKPLFWWSIVVMAFAWFYFGQHKTGQDGCVPMTITQADGTSKKVSDPSNNPFDAALFLSLKRALPLVGYEREKTNQSYVCLFGQNESYASSKKELIPNIPNLVIKMGILETILATIFIFLFGLAVRNHFRMK